MKIPMPVFNCMRTATMKILFFKQHQYTKKHLKMDVFFNNGSCKQPLPNLSYIENVQLFFYNTCHKKIPIRHSMYFFLIENDNSQSIILYIPTLIKEIEKNEDKNISYAIHKTS